MHICQNGLKVLGQDLPGFERDRVGQGRVSFCLVGDPRGSNGDDTGLATFGWCLFQSQRSPRSSGKPTRLIQGDTGGFPLTP